MSETMKLPYNISEYIIFLWDDFMKKEEFKTVTEGNAFYELDLECIRKKNERTKISKSKQTEKKKDRQIK